MGWIDFDPTNNVMPETAHITLAYGRDFNDVSPVSGIITGGGKHDVKAGVTVSVL
jgi:transglutaminase-like putative cysteine protease